MPQIGDKICNFLSIFALYTRLLHKMICIFAPILLMPLPWAKYFFLKNFVLDT